MTWLRNYKDAAQKRYLASSPPTEADEDWRYSRIDDLDLDAYVSVEHEDGEFEHVGDHAPTQAVLSALGQRSGWIRTVNGRVVAAELSATATKAGIVLARAEDVEDTPAHFGSVLGAQEDAFTLLASANARDVVVVAIPPRTELAAPLVIVHELVAGDVPTMVFPRTLVNVGANSSASVVEFIVSGDESFLVVPIVEVNVAEDARLSYQGIQQLGRRSWQLGSHVSRIASRGELTLFLAALGGEYARQVTAATLDGESASSRLFSVYFGDDQQVQDLRSFQEHAAARTKSELVFKGAVAGSARSVYSGLIHIHKGATKSDASQTNRNLVLSEGALAYSVPNLDIEENDVRCTHASAVGPIDPELRFYLESRGLPPETADRLVLLGFFEDLLVRATEPGIARYLTDALAARLARAHAHTEV